jgi:hypothetical protein
MALALCYLNLLFCNYQKVDLTIDIPKVIQSNEVALLSGTICNGSAKNISFWNVQLHNSLYRGDIHWDIIILKEEQRFFIPIVFFGKTAPPKVIELKKNGKFLFEIPVSFKELSKDGFLSLDSIESGKYEIQLIVSLKIPKNTTIKSNTVECYLNVNE